VFFSFSLLGTLVRYRHRYCGGNGGVQVCLRACGVGSSGVMCGIIPQKSVGAGERGDEERVV